MSGLSAIQRLLRELLLRELATYRAAGRFPKNPGFAERTPTFVDAEGTRCAMAHLLELGGEHELVAKIARERNHARVKDLADETRLLTWLQAAGLTVEEAAVIQPSYSASPSQCVCRKSFSMSRLPVPATAVIEATLTAPGTARIDAVYGAAKVRVGELLTVTSQEVGSRVLIAFGTGDAKAEEKLDSSSRWACKDQEGHAAPGITPAEFAQVAMASDCLTAAEGLPAFNSRVSRMNCAAADDATSLGVLLAIAGVLLARRLR
ncbi:MAG: hypothetical protein QM817_07900 [Archangium sp.]